MGKNTKDAIDINDVLGGRSTSYEAKEMIRKQMARENVIRPLNKIISISEMDKKTIVSFFLESYIEVLGHELKRIEDFPGVRLHSNEGRYPKGNTIQRYVDPVVFGSFSCFFSISIGNKYFYINGRMKNKFLPLVNRILDTVVSKIKNTK